MKTTPELHAWESATVQTLNPILSDANAAALWEAILKNRAAPSAETFGADMRAIAAAEAVERGISERVPQAALGVTSALEAVLTLSE